MAKNWKRAHDSIKQQCSTQAGDLRLMQEDFSALNRENLSLVDTISGLRLKSNRGAMQMHAAAEQLETLDKTHAAALLHAQAVDLAS